MGGMLQANVQWGPHHTAARMLFLSDLGSFPDGSDDSVGEFSILYGRRTAGRWGHASLATGLAYVRGEGFPGTYDRVRSGAGVPVVGEVLLHARLVGVGLQLFANLNTVSIYGGAMLSLHLGWMP